MQGIRGALADLIDKVDGARARSDVPAEGSGT
jgi:hypothetical protein